MMNFTGQDTTPPEVKEPVKSFVFEGVLWKLFEHEHQIHLRPDCE